MKTRFSLKLDLDETEQTLLFQAFQYLIEFQGGEGVISRELADHLAAGSKDEPLPERRFAELIGSEPIGIDIMAMGDGGMRLGDIDGEPNLRMLCQIIANLVPRLLPLEFSFALVDDVNHRYSGGLVVMTTTMAEVQTIDSMLARRGGKMLH